MEETEQDTADDTPSTYTPRRTHHLTMEQKAPHGETQTLQYQIKEGMTYDVLDGKEADDELGRAPVNNVTGKIRKSALP